MRENVTSVRVALSALATTRSHRKRYLHAVRVLLSANALVPPHYTPKVAATAWQILNS